MIRINFIQVTFENLNFLDSKYEKDARGIIKSKVSKYLDKKIYVIVDSLNYIKGFRFELFKIARTSDTTNCVVRKIRILKKLFCDVDLLESIEWNEAMEKEKQYKENM
jgi:protein KTI12